MELQGGQEADDAVRNPLAGFGQAVVVGWLQISRDVDAPAWAIQQALGEKSPQIDSPDREPGLSSISAVFGVFQFVGTY